MNTTLEWILAQAQSCSGIRRLILFGSRAKQTHHERSDYDLAIDWDLKVPNLEWASFCEHLREKNPSLNQIDLVRIDLVGEELQQKIRCEGKVLYDKSSTKL